MKTLNKKAIAGSPIFLREKGENTEIKGFTLECATVCETATEGEVMVAVTFAESPKRFWASSSLANFILDNVDVDKVNETDLDFRPYNITVTYLGKKRSKNNREFNNWEVKIP